LEFRIASIAVCASFRQFRRIASSVSGGRTAGINYPANRAEQNGIKNLTSKSL
jgi:hypothetical protein